MLNKGRGEDRVFEEPPVGTFTAILVGAIDEGEKPNPFFKQGDEEWKRMKHDVRLQWIISAKMSDGRPFMVGDWCPLRVGFGKKVGKLRARLEALSGMQLAELDAEVDAKCEMDLVNACMWKSALVTLHLNEAGKVRVNMVTPIPRGPDGLPMLPLPDVNPYRASKGLTPLGAEVPLDGPITPNQRDLIMARARSKIGLYGGNEDMHHKLIEDVKAILGVQSATTMRRSQVDPFLRAIDQWKPEALVEPEAKDDIPF
jgi:hypothetical protein